MVKDFRNDGLGCKYERVSKPLIKEFIKKKEGFLKLTNWKQWSVVKKFAVVKLKKYTKKEVVKMKRALSVLCLLGLLLLSSCVTAFAGTDAEDILTSYLNAIVNQNVEEILAFVIDERYSSDDCDFQKEEYTHFLKEKKLIDYKITNMSQESPTLINFEAILTYDNGSIEKVPFVLRYDKSWKVIINANSLEKNYEVIQEGIQEPEANTSSSISVFAGTDAEDILTSYLNAIANQNVEEILTFVIDERYSSDDCDFQKEEYTHFLKEKKLIDYKITNMSQESPTLINFEAILTYDNGSIEKVPFVLRYDKSWKVIINANSLEKNYEVIQEGTQEPEANT
ncbi:hypothetical protein Dtox_2758 [Desulfofarcimen acetoxidans DSM 771]|uniref:DUF4878 domain-containing protein n=1 Tax=Desulfofarcimen acetoxidans (strain ATCC 49208 / DSM 771 / KCTC 5769 / VKM B-1644 / 5575) TaxID=485916 RepID=C8W1R3_DESAS|nr:hypothetical protein [Desulfofarcimen acetoxidans]ACV63534.1 hypothetical protein Dtox_2758 [Desulfofarcimen acetoxidans DSM 771]